MPLMLPGESFPKLRALVQAFNAVPENDHVQKLFYLQKIDNEVNRENMNAELFAWYNHSGEEGQPGGDGFEQALAYYDILLTASFFSRRVQFADAVKGYAGNAMLTEDEQSTCRDATDERRLVTEHQGLLDADTSWQDCASMFITSSLKMAHLAETSTVVGERVRKHRELHALAANKIQRIRDKAMNPCGNFRCKIERLGEEQNNNHNYIVTFGDGDTAPLVMRVTDQESLSLDRRLSTEAAVSQYFNEEYAQFMHAFTPEGGSLTYMSVALGNLANQGNLQDVAQQIYRSNHPESEAALSTPGERKHPQDIGTTTIHYFRQLVDFLINLQAKGVYHPDSKLTNYLVHSKRVVVSDRKTFLTEDMPEAGDISTSPMYAPPEFAACLNRTGTEVDARKAKTEIPMQPFMAWQVGLALKEFMLTAILGDKLTRKLPKAQQKIFGKAMDDQDFDIATLLTAPGNRVQNLWLLAQELTHLDADKRLSLIKFQKLAGLIGQPPMAFAKMLEKESPAHKLGYGELTTDILLRLEKKGPLNTEALEEINGFFAAIYDNAYTSARLAPYAKRLAYYCHLQSHGLEALSERIETALWEQDWQQASLGQKLRYWLTLTLWRVDRATTLEQLAGMLAVDDGNFFNVAMQLELLPKPYLQGVLGSGRYENLSGFMVHTREHREAQLTGTSETPAPSALSAEASPDSHVDSALPALGLDTMVIRTEDEPPAFNTMILCDGDASDDSESMSESLSTMVVKHQPQTMIARVLTMSPTASVVHNDSDDDSGSEFNTTEYHVASVVAPSPWDTYFVRKAEQAPQAVVASSSSSSSSEPPQGQEIPPETAAPKARARRYPSIESTMMRSLKRLSIFAPSITATDNPQAEPTPAGGLAPADSSLLLSE